MKEHDLVRLMIRKRKDRGLSLRTLSRVVGVSPGHLGNIEKRRVEMNNEVEGRIYNWVHFGHRADCAITRENVGSMYWEK